MLLELVGVCCGVTASNYLFFIDNVDSFRPEHFLRTLRMDFSASIKASLLTIYLHVCEVTHPRRFSTTRAFDSDPRSYPFFLDELTVLD